MGNRAEAGRNVPQVVDVVVIGARFAGPYANDKFRQLDLRAFGCEAAAEVGGAWFWNRYPGRRIDAVEAAQVAWAHEVANMAEKTLNTKADSWSMGANVPGKPRVFLMFIGGLDRYVERCDKIVSEGYTGFNFSPAMVEAS